MFSQGCSVEKKNLLLSFTVQSWHLECISPWAVNPQPASPHSLPDALLRESVAGRNWVLPGSPLLSLCCLGLAPETGRGTEQPGVGLSCSTLDLFLASALALEPGLVQAWSPLPARVTFGAASGWGGVEGGSHASLLRSRFPLGSFSTVSV